MSNQMLDSAESILNTAAKLNASADEMADARRRAMRSAQPPTPQEVDFSILRENAMRDAVNTLLLRAVNQVVTGVKGSQEDLEKAVDEANEKLKKIADIKRALAVFAGLFGLAEALVLGKPDGIVKAIAGVKKAAQAA